MTFLIKNKTGLFHMKNKTGFFVARQNTTILSKVLTSTALFNPSTFTLSHPLTHILYLFLRISLLLNGSIGLASVFEVLRKNYVFFNLINDLKIRPFCYNILFKFGSVFSEEFFAIVYINCESI